MSKHNTEAFGAALRAAREASGKSQGEVAKYLGVSVSYVSDIERGRRAPLTYDNLCKVVHFLGADLERFVAARAKWHGCVEVPLTGHVTNDRRAVGLAVAVLKSEAR